MRQYEETCLDDELSRLFDPCHPGAAVLVMKNGHVIFRQGFGLADIASQTPIETDMVFRLGSVSKQFTAVAILMLAENKLLDLQADITAYIPYPTRGKRITIEHLLTHTSGIVDYTSRAGFDDQADRDRTVADMIAWFQDEPLGFEPGERYGYSNSNYFLLGAIIEAVSGTSFGTFMEQHVFIPLSMDNTAYEGMERHASRRAAGYQHTPDGFVPCDVISMSQPYAAGAIVSTVEDLALWERALGEGVLLKPEMLARAFQPFILNDGASAGYGYGWDVTPICSTAAQWHDGGINGYSTFVLRMPVHGLFIAVLSNCEEGMIEPKEVAERIVGACGPALDAIDANGVSGSDVDLRNAVHGPTRPAYKAVTMCEFTGPGRMLCSAVWTRQPVRHAAGPGGCGKPFSHCSGPAMAAW